MSSETDRFADPVWEAKCSVAFLDCLKDPKLGAAEWARQRHALDLEKPNQKVRLDSIDLRNKDLEGYGFPFCYLIRIQFNGCNLKNTRFDQTVIDDCNFDESDISGSTFYKAHIIGRTFLTPQPLTNRTNLVVRSLYPSVIVSEFLRKEIRQQRLIADWDRHPTGLIMKIWNRATIHGTKAWLPVLLTCGFIVAAFSTIYSITYALYPESLGLSQNRKLGLPDILLFSAERFINSTSALEVKSELMRLVQNLETVLGIGAVALVTALIVRHLLKDDS